MKAIMLYLLFTLFYIVNLNAQDSTIIVEPQSLQSLYIEAWSSGKPVGSATGFVIRSKTRNYLITNWHVVTNKSPKDKSWLPGATATPDQIFIRHRNAKVDVDKFYVGKENLINDKGKPLYKEFSKNGQTIDVVAIPLRDTNQTNITLFPVDYELTNEEVLLSPAELISVVGYPKGASSALNLPIWKTGTVASDIAVDQENMPIIFVDMLGYHGMSGSPVFYISNMATRKSGAIGFSGRRAYFLGVFSHVYEDLQLGAVWKSSHLKGLFDTLD